MKRINIANPEFEYDDSDPEGFRSGMDRIGPKLGAKQMGTSVYEIPPGQALCPYHYEYAEEEWLLVLIGRPTLRDPDGETELEPWDVVMFETGPSGAHGDLQPDRRAGAGDDVVDRDAPGGDGVSGQRQDRRLDRQREDDAIVERSSKVEYFHGEV